MPRAHIVYEGPHSLDVTELTGQLIDLSGGGRRGMRCELEGFQGARMEVLLSNEGDRNTAGFNPDVVAHFQMCDERLARINQKLVVAQKLVEVLVESRAFYTDAQQNDMSMLMDTLRSVALRRRDHAITAPFEKALRYCSQIGDKGAKTKRRKAAGKAAAGSGPEAP